MWFRWREWRYSWHRLVHGSIMLERDHETIIWRCICGKEVGRTVLY